MSKQIVILSVGGHKTHKSQVSLETQKAIFIGIYGNDRLAFDIFITKFKDHFGLMKLNEFASQ